MYPRNSLVSRTSRTVCAMFRRDWRQLTNAVAGAGAGAAAVFGLCPLLAG